MQIDALTVQIAKLELKAGDTLVLMTDLALPMESHERVRAMLAPSIPEGARCIVLDRGVTLAKISKTD